MKLISLGSSGKFAKIDDLDFESVSKFSWKLKTYSDRTVQYAYRNISAQSRQYLHQFVMQTKGIDHKNHDGLDCRRSNLRLANQSQNMANKRIGRNNTSGFKGVSWSKVVKKWHAYISINKKRQHIGYFLTKEDAAAAYGKAARAIFGEFACL